MIKENKVVLDELNNIMINHNNVVEEYNYILKNHSYRNLSKGDSIYGMYFPDKELTKYFTYNGKLTKNEKTKDFAYYFDENNKLILTERFSNGTLLNAILFYYYENKVEIVWYCMKRKKINAVGEIIYLDNRINKFIESGDALKHINSFIEYTFEEDYIKIKSYLNYSNGKELIKNSTMKR